MIGLHAKRRRINVILISLAVGILPVLFFVTSAHAQATYYMMPVQAVSNITHGPNVVTATTDVDGNHWYTVGTCGHAGLGWGECYTYITLPRDGSLNIVGMVVEWESILLGPNDSLIRLSGNLMSTLDQRGLPSNSPDYRQCATDVDPADITIFGCEAVTSNWNAAKNGTLITTTNTIAPGAVNTRSGDRNYYHSGFLYWIVGECPTGWTPGELGICEEDETPPPPPPSDYPIDPGFDCSFNYTATITTTSGTTGTAHYSYTVEANLIRNYSFEDADAGGFYPAHWTFESNVPPLVNTWWGNSPLIAKTGNRFMDSFDQSNYYSLIQDMTLYSAGRYMAGIYVHPSSAWYGAHASGNLIWNGSSVVQTGIPITTTANWTVFTGTRTTGGGSAWFEIRYYSLIQGTNTDVYLDDVFVFPLDDSDQILCSPEYYPVPEPITTTLPTGGGDCAIVFGGLCFPSATDSACWQCQRPTSLLQLGEWITWLVCQVRNLFFCHLYNWLLVFANWSVGLYQNVISFLSWLPNTAQNILTWIGNVWNNVLGWVNGLWTRIVTGFTNWLRTLVQNVMNSSFVQAVFNFVAGINYVWELFVTLVETFLQMIRAIYNGILELINLVVDLVLAVREAMLAEAYDWDFLPGFSGESETEISREAAIADEGGATWSETQAIYIFLMALGAGDAVLAEFGIQYIQFLIIGAISVGLIWWTLRKWEYILPV